MKTSIEEEAGKKGRRRTTSAKTRGKGRGLANCPDTDFLTSRNREGKRDRKRRARLSAQRYCCCRLRLYACMHVFQR
jgi:hypothetical protein